MAKDIIKINSASSRTFEYTLKNCVLRFTLRVDNTDELIPYKELLTLGLSEVEAEIKKVRATRKKKIKARK
jgi:hypothetical protein